MATPLLPVIWRVRFNTKETLRIRWLKGHQRSKCHRMFLCLRNHALLHIEYSPIFPVSVFPAQQPPTYNTHIVYVVNCLLPPLISDTSFSDLLCVIRAACQPVAGMASWVCGRTPPLLPPDGHFYLLTAFMLSWDRGQFTAHGQTSNAFYVSVIVRLAFLLFADTFNPTCVCVCARCCVGQLATLQCRAQDI